MKSRSLIWRGLSLIALASIIGTLTFTPFLANVWNVVTGRGYEIPDESSLLTFQVTEMNHGSGEWWLHAEDDDYYYAYSETPGIRYHAFPKSKVQSSTGFQPNDSSTWNPEFTISRKTNE